VRNSRRSSTCFSGSDIGADSNRDTSMLNTCSNTEQASMPSICAAATRYNMYPTSHTAVANSAHTGYECRVSFATPRGQLTRR